MILLPSYQKDVYKRFLTKLRLLNILLTCTLLSNLAVHSYGQNSLSPNSSYQPPQFLDSDRVKKMEAAFPAIEAIYKQHAEKNNIPGLAFGIVADGKLIYSGATGFSDVNSKTQVSNKTVFRIASMSKSFTAMAILKLRDEGKLKLDAPASTYIPQMKKIQYLTKDSPPITIRHLLTHMAGFPEDNPWGDRQLADTDEELMNLLNQGVALSNIPGTTYEYSNLGFALLGYIIKKVSNTSYQQYINTQILTPLQMHHTYWEYTQVPSKQLAQGYRRVNAQWQQEALLHDGAYGAMGGLLTSIEDFSRYVALHLSARPPSNEEEKGPLKRSSIREMHRPWNMSGFYPGYTYPNGKVCPRVSGYGYGLGWSKDCSGRETVGHSGGLPGFGSHWIILPDYGFGVVSFSNLTYAAPIAVNFQVVDTLISLANLEPRQLPVSQILKHRKTDLIKLLPDWNKAKESGLFAENFFQDYSLDSLKKQATTLFTKAGKILRSQELNAENQLRGNFVLEGEKTNIDIHFTLTPENPPLIQEFHIQELPKR